MKRIVAFGIAALLLAGAVVLVSAVGGERLAMPEPLAVDYLDGMKVVSTAATEFSTLPTGQRRLTIRHEVIAGVTPEMLVWWFHQFPTRTITVAGEEVGWYRLWHPKDHIAVVIEERGDPEVPGISPGARIVIHERIGGAYQPFEGHVAALDENGIHLVAKRGGTTVGNLRHTFKAVEGGTLYESELVLGIEAPVLRLIVNAAIRSFLMTDEQAHGWFTHNVEEVGNLQFFLPDLYAEYGRRE